MTKSTRTPWRNWATATADQKKRAAAKGRKAVFAGALARLSRRGGWTQGTNARNKSGKIVPPVFSTAYSFCALGAIEAAAFELQLPNKVVRDCVFQIEQVIPGGSITCWNDSVDRKKKDVLAAFREAAK